MAEVISLVALLMSGVSLAWQIKTWRSGGHVVVVTAHNSYTVGHPEDAVICVTVRNDGRAAVEVDGCFIALGQPQGQRPSVMVPLAPTGKRRLEAHSSLADYRIPVRTFLSMVDAVNLREYGIHAAAQLATNVMVLSADPISLERFLP